MEELRKLEAQAEEVEVIEGPPKSGPRVAEEFRTRAMESRQEAARIFATHPADARGAVLRAHADPFGRAIEIEDEVA